MEDPRTCLTLPFWRELVPDLLPVVCLREPSETARSFAELGELGWAAVQRLSDPFETGLDLWLRYTGDALEQTQEQPRHIVFYDELVDDPLGQSGRLAAFADLSECLTPDRRRQIEAFLQPSLRHQLPRETSGKHPALALYARLRERRD